MVAVVARLGEIVAWMIVPCKDELADEEGPHLAFHFMDLQYLPALRLNFYKHLVLPVRYHSSV